MILKLKPAYKDYLWGGQRLINEFAKAYDGNILAESWELSCHKNGESRIANKEFENVTLGEFIEKNGRSVLGDNCIGLTDFPILIKLIDADQDLSVQVHPDDEYALANEGQYGKTELWYIVDANPGAFIYYGFKENISKDEFKKRIENNTILEVLNKVYVKKGNRFLIEAGTIHAIGAGIIIAEIQQNSDVTYRVYDYDRRNTDGSKRELHIDKAADVTDFSAARSNQSMLCRYFNVEEISLNGVECTCFKGFADSGSFVSILILDGEGTVSSNEILPYKKGDCFFITADSGAFTINGNCKALLTSVPHSHRYANPDINA